MPHKAFRSSRRLRPGCTRRPLVVWQQRLEDPFVVVADDDAPVGGGPDVLDAVAERTGPQGRPVRAYRHSVVLGTFSGVFVERVGQIVTGPVTKVLPIGVIVRIEDREDGFEGMVLNETVSDMVARIKDGFERQVLDETDHGPLAVGDVIPVRIVEVDPSRRHIRLAHVIGPHRHRSW
ncbi:S1 RNA-binding domain-containing protein [Glycomyces luteolus]|uniref:S1 RNA-binding domain-containing protein n=1 Tax=Glycomyces luteolus TaxID=2670330 RepID=UPI0038CC0D22